MIGGLTWANLQSWPAWMSKLSITSQHIRQYRAKLKHWGVHFLTILFAYFCQFQKLNFYLNLVNFNWYFHNCHQNNEQCNTVMISPQTNFFFRLTFGYSWFKKHKYISDLWKYTLVEGQHFFFFFLIFNQGTWTYLWENSADRWPYFSMRQLLG